MISLLFKFFGDSTPLRQEAEKAKKDMGKAGADIGKEFGSQFKGLVMQTIGLGAVAGIVKSAVGEVTKSVATANASGGSPGAELAMARVMEATGMTREQITEVARVEPQKFAAMVKRFESPMSDEQMRMTADALTDLTTAVKNTGDTLLSALTFVATANNGEMRGFPVIGSTGFSPGGLTPSQMRFNTQGAVEPTRAFIDAAQAKFASDAVFNELVDVTWKQIAETQRVREAVERN